MANANTNTNNKVKLYYSPGACSLAPHILLPEANLPAGSWEAIELSIEKTGSFPVEHCDLNPKLRVPVLQILEGNSINTITETPAIMTAISQLAQEKHLFGTTPLETLRVYEWISYLSESLQTQAFGLILRPERLSDDPSAHPGIKAKGLKNLVESLEYIEGILPSHSSVHAVGGRFTAVDVHLYIFYRWASREGVLTPAKFPKYSALVAELLKRKSVLDALEVEGVASHAPVLTC